MKILKPIIITGLTIALLAWALPTVSYADVVSLILASVVLTLLQKIAKPVLKVLFLPINIVTLGLFSLVINVFILWLGTFLVPGLEIQSMTLGGVALGEFMSLLVISFVLSFVQGFLTKIL
jgi:putative membrane protein